MAEEKKGFWNNLPALITAIGGLITAIAAVLILIPDVDEPIEKNEVRVEMNNSEPNEKPELFEDISTDPEKIEIKIDYRIILNNQEVKEGNFLPIENKRYSAHPLFVSENPPYTNLEIRMGGDKVIIESKLQPNDYLIFEDEDSSYRLKLLRIQNNKAVLRVEKGAK